ncbi:MAG: helix-turn-helix domain-containing protein [Kiritimatiellia bacterium]
MNDINMLALTTPGDVREALRRWVRTERQRVRWTQSELARRSGVPSATISRLELTGLGSTDAVFKILFALDRLDALADFLKERQRLADLPVSLKDIPHEKPVLRIRARKARP